MVILKQFGIYRTGTNVLKVFLEKNLSDITIYPNKMGHKHSYFDIYRWNEDGGDSNTGLLISIKHPYSWLVSRAKWKVIDEFRFVPSGNTIDDIDEITLCEWCQLYNNLYEHWFTLPYVKEIIKYEELLSTPNKVLERVRDRWKLIVKTDAQSLPVCIINPGEHMKQIKFDPSYYLQHKYLRDLKDVHKKILNKYINWDLLSDIGYYKNKL